MYQMLDTSRPDLVALRVSGTLGQEDYDTLVPALEARIQRHGSIRVLVHLAGFEGWKSLGAGWTDLRMDLRLTPHVDRLAVVGDRAWERWMTKLSDPLLPTDMRWFEGGELDAARRWIEEDGAATEPSSS